MKMKKFFSKYWYQVSLATLIVLAISFGLYLSYNNYGMPHLAFSSTNVHFVGNGAKIRYTVGMAFIFPCIVLNLIRRWNANKKKEANKKQDPKKRKGSNK